MKTHSLHPSLIPEATRKPSIRHLAMVSLIPFLAMAWATNTARSAETTPAAWQTPPGWTQTRGGEGGRVIRVTTLAPTGAGSLAEAIATAGPRTIEFDVAGIIDLAGVTLRIREPHLTIAGETAPSPGITLTNGGISLTTNDVIIRHLRTRPGAGDRARGSGWEVDGLATGAGARDVIIDHCSFSWATDENLSASGPQFSGATPDEWRRNTSHRITFSHCIIGEALSNSTHGKGLHSMGTLVHDNVTDIAIVGNLYISNDDRNPLFKGGARGAIVNNVIHNPGLRVMQYGFVDSQWRGRETQRGIMVIAGNVARKGASTVADIAFLDSMGPVDVYLNDNLFFDASGDPVPVSVGFREAQAGRNDQRRLSPVDPKNAFRQVDTPPFWPPNLQARPASETTAWVLANAGARPWDRDAVDRRLVEEAATGGGRIIDFESEVGGLPE